MTDPASPSGPHPAARTGGPPPSGYRTPPPSQVPPGYPPLPPGYRYVLPALAPDGRPLASFGDRVVARIIDGLIFGAVGIVLAIPVFVVFIAQLPPSGSDGRAPAGNFAGFVLAILGVEAGWFVLVLALTYLYEVEMLLRSGQTIGKRIMKIKVIPLAPGVPLTRRSAAMRWLVGNVATAFVPLFNWLDGLWQLWDKPYQQCLHDKAASTVVVKLAR
jgi:uncharacterized RDD family membrane protein YckC